MDAMKERILGAITVMSKEDTLRLWRIIKDEFSDDEVSWALIPEEEPDEIDLQMLKEIEENPDCNEFISSQEAKKILGVA